MLVCISKIPEFLFELTSALLHMNAKTIKAIEQDIYGEIKDERNFCRSIFSFNFFTKGYSMKNHVK